METPVKTITKKIVFVDVLKEGWGMVYGFKKPVFMLQQVTFGLAMVIGAMILGLVLILIGNSFIHHTGKSSPADIINNPLILVLFMIFFVVFSILYNYINIILTIMGIRKAIHLPTSISMAYAACKSAQNRLLIFFILYSIVLLVFTFGFVFLLLRSLLIVSPIFSIIILLVNTMLMQFMMPLVVLKKMPLSQAFSVALKKIKLHVPVVFSCALLFGILSALVVSIPHLLILASIANIWIQPFYYASFGVLFREVYGLTPQTPPPTKPPEISA